MNKFTWNNSNELEPEHEQIVLIWINGAPLVALYNLNKSCFVVSNTESYNTREKSYLWTEIISPDGNVL